MGTRGGRWHVYPGAGHVYPWCPTFVLWSGLSCCVFVSQPVLLPCALRSSHLPAGAADFESSLLQCIKSGSQLTSSSLRAMLAPAACAGVNAPAGRSLQDDFDGAVACLSGLMGAYTDLVGLLQQVQEAVAGAGGGDSSSKGGVLEQVQQLMNGFQHVTPFTEAGASSMEAAAGGGEEQEVAASSSGSSGSGRPGLVVGAAVAAAGGAAGDVVGVARSNMAALAARLRGWEQLVKSHQVPSRVVRWAASA